MCQVYFWCGVNFRLQVPTQASYKLRRSGQPLKQYLFYTKLL